MTYQTLNLDFNIPSDLDSGKELKYLKDQGYVMVRVYFYLLTLWLLRGPIPRTKWYRVICDEAQFIRNRSTQCSVALAMLWAKYRWPHGGTDHEHLVRSFRALVGKMQTGDCRAESRHLRISTFRPFPSLEVRSHNLSHGRPETDLA